MGGVRPDESGRNVTAVVAVGVVSVVVLATACNPENGTAEAFPVEPVEECDWPMWGQNLSRTFAYPCETPLSVDTAAGLNEQWFFNTEDVVTATPAIVGDAVYVGDWSGRFYSLDLETGDVRWTYGTEHHEGAFFGQIVSSAVVHDLDGDDQVVIFGAGKTLYALDTSDGSERWHHELVPDADETDPTEIEVSPVVVDDTVIFGYDGHNAPGVRAGVVALDVETGDVVWDFDPDEGEPPTGCVGVWSSPSVDVARGLLFVGGASCRTAPDGWRPYTEAIYALSLDTGEPQWTFQPHEPEPADLDFGGAPNLFAADGRDLVGLGNKDASYYTLTRDGELVWSTQVTEGGFDGGFIGPTAVADGVIAGGTGTEACPCLHGLDAGTGEILWQQEAAAGTFAASAIADGVLFVGGTDFTFRAVDLRSGEILWSHEMTGAVSGGPAIKDDHVAVVAGIREPGIDSEPSETSGVTMFSLDEPPDTTTTRPEHEATGERVRVRLEPTDQDCVGSPCVVTFGINDPPQGTTPLVELLVEPDPFRVEVSARDLGDPADWIRPGSEAAEVGATAYGVVISESDDDPQGGGVLCTFTADESGCSTDTLPVLRDSFNRITVLALEDTETIPTVRDGADRLVRTQAFETPLVPIPID